MAIIKKFASYQNLTNFQTFLIDDNPLSDYFRITEFKDTFTGGKNGFLIEGSEFLKESTELKVEVLDVNGNPVYYEPGDGNPEYYEGLSKLVAVHVYDDTPIGLGKITILGELKEYIDGNGIIRPVPKEWQGVYNVKWERTFKINKNLPNEDIVRFYKRPIISIEEIVKPIFNKTIPTKTISGSVSGVPQQPIEGANLNNWRAGTFYKLIKSTGSWDIDIDENPITVSVDGNTYTPTIIEVLNEREVLVDVPYTSNNIVQSFTSQSFTASYQDVENEVVGDSPLTGSFAKIDMYQLKTFVGDVARVKIFRKSRNQVNDFQLVQESKLESTELLRDIYVSDAVEIPYGRFSTDVLSNYWITSSNDHPTSVNSAVLSQAVKVDYNNLAEGVQKLITKESFSIAKDVEYTLSFRTLLSGSVSSDKYVKAYFSGSYINNLNQTGSYIQNFMHVSGSNVYKTRQNVSQNILAERDIDAKLVLEFKGDDWYVSNVSLRNAQETSFSPDEFTLIQDIPRKLDVETFDFRFEFYDINNNYIPVDVTATKEFDGGNDYVIGGTSARILTFESDRNAFRYASGSATPSNQTIFLQHTKTNLTGSIIYTSGAFDLGGNLLTSSGWEQYPGLLTNRTDSTNGGSAILTVENFSGSWTGSGTQPEVYSIVYTASVEDLVEYETVFRVEDGDNAPQLLVTSNANQFIYEPTTLSPKPSGQNITVRAQRKNLESLNSTITVTSGSNLPPLIEVPGGDTGGVKTYTISALQFSESFAANDFDEVTYNFSSNDILGNPQTDEITISKVVNFDAVSFRLSNPTHTFTANSTGVVTSDFSTGNGSVTMFVAGNQIQFDDNGSRNTFEITNLQGTGCTPIGGNGFDPTTNQYGITSMSLDSASLDVTITYTAGDNSTTQSFTENVTYTKTRIAAPVLSIETTNKDQSVSAFSTGEQVDSFVNATVTVKEQYGGSTTTKTITALTATSGDISNISTTPSTGLITLNGETLANGTNNTTIAVSATVTDSEGTSRTLTDTISLSKVKKAQPSITFSANPESQTVTAASTGTLLGTIQDVAISGFEGNTALTYNQGTLSEGQYKITDVTGVSVVDTTPNTATNGVIDITSFSGDSATGIATIEYKDSEGTSGTVTKKFSLSKAKKAPPVITTLLDPQTQTVDSNATFTTVGTPQDITLIVNEGGNNYSYQSGATVGPNEFKITGITTGAGTNNNDGTITPTTPTDKTGTSGVITYSYTNSEETAFTGSTISFSVGVSVQGDNGDSGSNGADAVSIELNPPSQEVVVDVTGSISSPDDFVVQVFDISGSFPYNATLAATPSFKIDTLTQTNHSGTPSNSSGTITPVVPNDVNGSDVSFNVTFRDRKGNLSSAISKTHKIIVVAEGSTGPGIVFTGVWDTNRIYQYDLQNGRRDAVLWSTDGNPPYDAYYVTLQQAGASIDSPDITTGSYWEYLGEQDFFVAAKIAIFEESYIQNTLNIGTNSSTTLSAANITLWGKDDYPYFSLGQSATAGSQGYAVGDGIFIGRDSADGGFKMSLENTSTNGWLKWNGSTLDIKGALTFTNQGSTDLSGFAGYAGLSGSVYDAQTAANQAASDAQTASGSAHDASGSAYLANQVANTNLGYLQNLVDGVSILGGGTYIDGNIIYSPNIAGNNGYFSDSFGVGDINGGNGIVLNGAGPSIYIGTGQYNNSNTPFYVSNAGGTSAFSLGDKLTFLESTGTLTVSGDIVASTISGSEVRGSQLIGATGDFSGIVTANQGEIGGWKIATNEIYSPSTGAKVMQLTAGGTPSISINDAAGDTVVDINSSTSLTALGSGGSNPSDLNSGDFDTKNSTIQGGYDQIISATPSAGEFSATSTTLTITDTATYSVEATITTDGPNGNNGLRYYYSANSSNTAGVTVSAKYGVAICTSQSNPAGTLVDYLVADFVDSNGAVPNGFSGVQYFFAGENEVVNKNITLTPGTYYLFPFIYDARLSFFPQFNTAPYNHELIFYQPDISSMDFAVSIQKTEINAGGLQVVSTNTNFVIMERDPAASSATDVMLEVGGSIEATGNITANASDVRLKNIKSKIENPLSKLKHLNGIIYTWNDLANQLANYNTDEEQIGLIAQEVQEILPQVTKLAPFDNDNHGNSKSGQNYLTIQYERIVPLLVESVKELSEKVEKLEEENKRLRDGNS